MAISAAGPVSAQGTGPLAGSEQLARGIAATIGATIPETSADAPISQKVSSHENIVEFRTSLRDEGAFAKLAADKPSYENGVTRFLCKPERFSYLQKGVIFHYVVSGPRGSETFDFFVDDRSCGASMRSGRAGGPTVARTAGELAQRMAAALSEEPATGGLRYEAATVVGDEVQVTEIVETAELADRIRKQGYQFRGITQGWFCGKFGSEISSGIGVHVVYKTPSGQTIMDISIDRSVC